MVRVRVLAREEAAWLLYESTLPDLRYVSTGDMNAEVGREAARRYGYERSDTD